MHFGRVQDPNKIQTDLPTDPLRTQKFLSLERIFRTETHIGCPIWSEKKWVGTLYPKGTKPSEFLSLYATHFSCVEVNSTFYHLLDSERIASWRDQTPSHFRFCPKVFRGISENLFSLELSQLILKFCSAIEAFQDRLGLTFMQFSESFPPSMMPVLLNFLQLWPKSIKLAIEFRHPGWFKEHALLDAIINRLYHFGVATVITDTPGRQDALHLSLTQPRVMIRFQGNNLHESDEVRLKNWSERIKSWNTGALQDIYFFAHQPDEGFIPLTTQLMLKYTSTNQVCDVVARRSRPGAPTKRSFVGKTSA